MIDIKHKTCIFENCKIRPNFNHKGEKKGLYCNAHKLEGMINLDTKKLCEEKDCKSKKTNKPITASYNFPGLLPKYCSKHKKVGMVDTLHTNRICKYKNCYKIAIFNLPETKKVLYCFKHKNDDMIDIYSKKCKTPLCNIKVKQNYKGYCYRCYSYMFPDEQISRNYKTKENEVVKYIKENFQDFGWVFDKIISGGCSSRRPDCFVDLGTHMIIVENDENQHIDYDTTCENRRLMELSQDIAHRPMIMIRFNPDSYIDTNGQKIESCWKINNKTGKCELVNKNDWNNRLSLLGDEIEKWIEIGCNLDKTVEVVSLFYDTNENEYMEEYVIDFDDESEYNDEVDDNESEYSNEVDDNDSEYSDNIYTVEKLEKYIVKDLKELCKTLSISGYSKKKKDELVDMIMNR
jgi:hypothetical protein